jgi:acetoin utilization protein AcuB
MMLVGKRMAHPVITISPDLPISEALNLMQQENIRRIPVVQGGKLVGIISDRDLLNASPTPTESLSIEGANYLINNITLDEVMTPEVLSIETTTPIEEAARIMSDNNIGALPVLEQERVVGIITETDLFKIFLELMGARDEGVRVTALVSDKIGQLAVLSKAIAEAGGNFVAFGQTDGQDPSNREITFKVTGLDENQVTKAIKPFVEEVEDIRTSHS